MEISAILGLITLLEPQIVNVIMMIKDKKTGTMSVIAVLDSVDAQTEANQRQIADWVARKQTPVTTTISGG